MRIPPHQLRRLCAKGRGVREDSVRIFLLQYFTSHLHNLFQVHGGFLSEQRALLLEPAVHGCRTVWTQCGGSGASNVASAGRHLGSFALRFSVPGFPKNLNFLFCLLLEINFQETFSMEMSFRREKSSVAELGHRLIKGGLSTWAEVNYISFGPTDPLR